MSPEELSPDVLVVGGGPAGSTLSALLSRRGWSVMVIDKAPFPRGKPCGEFLSPGAVRALERLDFDVDSISRCAARLTGWTLQVGNRSVSSYFLGGGAGLSLPRSRFDGLLMDQALRRGTSFMPGVRYVTSSPDPERPAVRVEVRTKGRAQVVRPRFLVGAGGLRCPVAARIGAVRRAARIRKVSLTGRIRGTGLPGERGRLIVLGDLVVGVAPSNPEATHWNATVVVPSRKYGRRIARGAPAFFDESIEAAALVPAGALRIDGSIWASGPFDRPTRRLFAGRTVLVGDAAGYFDPFTGQGIYQALRSAEVLAPLLHLALAGTQTPDQAFRYYQRVIRRERRSTTRVQRGVEWALSGQRRQRAVLTALSRAPRLYTSVLAATTDTAGPMSALAAALTDQGRDIIRGPVPKASPSSFMGT